MLRRVHPGAAAGGSDAGGEPAELIDWEGIFALVVCRTGWTWDQAEQQLDLFRLKALTQHWRRQPPVEVLVAAYLDYQPPAPITYVSPDEEVSGELAQILSTMPIRTDAAPVDDTAWLAAMADMEPS